MNSSKFVSVVQKDFTIYSLAQYQSKVTDPQHTCTSIHTNIKAVKKKTTNVLLASLTNSLKKSRKKTEKLDQVRNMDMYMLYKIQAI